MQPCASEKPNQADSRVHRTSANYAKLKTFRFSETDAKSQPAFVATVAACCIHRAVPGSQKLIWMVVKCVKTSMQCTRPVSDALLEVWTLVHQLRPTSVICKFGAIRVESLFLLQPLLTKRCEARTFSVGTDVGQLFCSSTTVAKCPFRHCLTTSGLRKQRSNFNRLRNRQQTTSFCSEPRLPVQDLCQRCHRHSTKGFWQMQLYSSSC